MRDFARLDGPHLCPFQRDDSDGFSIERNEFNFVCCAIVIDMYDRTHVSSR